MRILKFLIGCMLGMGLQACDQQADLQEIPVKANEMDAVAFKVLPFPLTEVKLLDGPFSRATELNKKYILNYEPDRLLSKFRTEAGLQPKEKPYNGWENETAASVGVGGQSLAGHTLGHYLSALTLMYNTSGEKEFLDRANYIIDELAACQQADGSGFIGAVPNEKKIFMEQIARGDIRAQIFDLNGMWSPIYTQHKVMAGLRDAYRLCGNGKALEVESLFADWLNTILNKLNQDQLQKLLITEYGGMNEVLADLYADTRKEKYLKMAEIFYDKEVLDPLSQAVDVLPAKHANTQIPKIIGLARQYELTGNNKLKGTAEFFMNTVVKHHSYVTGGNANHEYFGPPDKLSNRLSNETTETCNVYNMLKLTQHLFEWDATADLADYYERAMFNQILSSQNPDDGRLIYNLSLEMGGYKLYEDPAAFTCCIGSGMESQSKYAGNIYFHNDQALYVSQFIASELNWKEKGIVLKQSTRYPDEQNSRFEFTTQQPVKLAFKIRHPYWLPKGNLKVLVNGKLFNTDQQPQSFYSIERIWKTGDIVEVYMPFSLRLENMPDNRDRVAIMYGPLVMAGDLGSINDPLAADSAFVPVIMSGDRDPQHWLTALPDSINIFETTKVGSPRNFVIKPFYKIHDRRYSVYFDMYTQGKWRLHLEEQQAEKLKRKELEAGTLDLFLPGDTKNETRHHLQGVNTYIENFKNRKPRVAGRKGWFSFDMKLSEKKPVVLVVEYWGGFTGQRAFEILINGKKIATENIAGKKDGAFIDVRYDIPEELIAGSDKIKILFNPLPENRAGPVFEARLIGR